MEDGWHLDDHHRVLEAEIASALKRQGKSGIGAEELVPRVIDNVLPDITDLLYASLAKRSNQMLREHRKLRRGFVKRNWKRWREGFDLLERLIVISQETGSAINNALRSTAVAENDALFEVVISNHARAIQVSREIFALMVAGFPDGALARWRTLHEIAVVTFFISQAGKDVAEMYILHGHVTAYKRAKNYMEHHERANLDPIGQQEMEHLKVAHDEIVGRYGNKMKHDYGWAAVALEKAKPTFADLEVATKLDHWRPRYKWSAINTHGAYRTMNSTLSTSECEEPVLAVAESNSGMTDPAHMTAISLNIATTPVITFEANLDRRAAAMVMQRLADEIGETFWRLDHKTYAKFQRAHQKRARLRRLLWFRRS